MHSAFNLDAAVADLIWMLSQANPMVSTNTNRDLQLRLRLRDTDQVAEVLQAAHERGTIEIEMTCSDRVIRLTAGRATPVPAAITAVAMAVQAKPGAPAKVASRPLKPVSISLLATDHAALVDAADARGMSVCRLASEIVETRLAGWAGANAGEQTHANL